MQTLSHRLLLKVVGGYSDTFEWTQPSLILNSTGQDGQPDDYNGDNNTDSQRPGSSGDWELPGSPGERVP